ncbi:MAG: hypothetical protein ABI068_12910 [Ktedonobacterales bacterium]
MTVSRRPPESPVVIAPTVSPAPLDPLGDLPLDPLVAALPKAELHLHQEWFARLDRVLAHREGRPPYDWRAWAQRLMAETPPGMPRLAKLSRTWPVAQELDGIPENFVARVEDLLEDAAADGAIFVEARFGKDALRPDFMPLFREAERRVQVRHPRLRAEAVICLLFMDEPERLEAQIVASLAAACDGLAGIDLLYAPYDVEADWAPMYRVIQRAADAGLGITAHAGEFATANIAAALRIPGLTRLGHAVAAAQDPRLLDALAESGATVECSLTCNVVLGAVPSYKEHPIRRFIEAGIPVVLCTDDPIQVCTTIGREYAVAHALGFSPHELLAITRNALRAAFTTPTRRTELLAELDAWVVAHPLQDDSQARLQVDMPDVREDHAP